jgi:hypothetical protein
MSPKLAPTLFVALGMRSEGKDPKNRVGYSFTKMLQHTGRFWLRIF